MKRLFLVSTILFCITLANAQNPFEAYGYTPKIATLSNGKYNEFHDLDTIVQIGTVLFNTQSKQIVAFLQIDTLNSEATLQPDIVSMWMSPDPLASEYPSLSPYAYCANNPIIYIDPDGRYIDVSNLTASEREAYDAKIKKLSSNKLFYAYHNRLVNSETTYYIMSGSGAGGSGSFNSSTNQIHSVDNIEVLAQEMFHAYQSDLGVYKSADLSVRETEGDIVSANIALSLGGLAMANPWDQGISFNYIDDDMNLNESVLTSAFDSDFNKAVDARINFYNNRQSSEGAEAPKTYIQKNSGSGALALKKLVREVNANQNMVGPRLQNGDFYSE